MATGNPAINAAIQQIVNAQKAPIVNAQARYDAQAQNQQTNITGLTKALADILGGIAPGVEKTYADASTRQAGFAKGFSDELQAQFGRNASNTSSFLQDVVDAPQSGVDQVRGQVAPAAAGDTLYGLQGFIPASTLNREGAAFTSEARGLPGIANTQGLQQIAKVQAAQRDEQSKTSDKLAEIAGTIPKLRSDLEAQAFDQRFKVGQANFAIDKFNAQQSLAASKFTLQQQMDAFNEKYKVSSLNLRGQSLRLQAQKFARQTLQSDRSYGMALAGLGLRKASAQRAALAAEYKLKSGGFSASAITKYNSLLQEGLDTLPKGTTYGQYVAKSVEHGVPLSLAVARANAHWTDPLQRGTAKALSGLLGVSTGDITAAAGLPTAGDYNQLTGVGGVKQTTGIILAAQSFLGVPYKWGGNDPKRALDCSSFIQQTFKRLGISLPRTTYAQVKAGRAVTLDQLQPGDAVFTRPGKNGPNHVGLYIGDGQIQESPHTGDVNKIIPLKDFLSGGFVAARRYVGNG